MARVTVFEGGNIQPQGTTTARIRPADFSASPLGTGLEKLGQAGSDYVDQQTKIDDIHDDATVKEATNAVTDYYSQLGYTGPDAYYSKSGKDALLAKPMVEKGLDSYIDDTKNGLKNDRQRELFDEAVKPQRTAWAVQIATHADKETQQYAVDESTNRAATVGELAKRVYVSDPAQGEQQIATGLSEFDALAKLKGWGPEQTANEKLKFSSGVYKDIGTRLAYEGGKDGPNLALGVINVHGQSMTADDREAVLTHARAAQSALDTEVRRQEAEQHRLEREVKSDAHDRAEAVLRNIQDGVVVDPKDLANAMGDARTAENPALVEGLRQGGLKNSLTQQYADATPAELQSRVNDLSAQITKAGGKVKPDLIVERDHLQTLVTNSRSALNQDPLSWGAQHLGVDIKPLNLNDQNSINDRLNAASLIARRTGTTPRPLMQDEVAASQQILSHGTVQDKVGLALRVSKLGPLALPAAEQLTNDAGFQNVIGLATHSNRGVAASRVTQIMTGYEVLKTKPKLIDKDQSQQQFDAMMGGALQFLPQVAAGVRSNAQALLASQANEHGWETWNDAQGGWVPAINSALGAYSRDGKRVGGLWTLNGGTTILPENTTGAEFENRISKSNGPEFRKAQNGDPVFGDGRTPTATDLKRMQWVPSGDGIYRISDGNGFIKTKAGGFYEIDFGKLNSFDAQLAAHGYTRR